PGARPDRGLGARGLRGDRPAAAANRPARLTGGSAGQPAHKPEALAKDSPSLALQACIALVHGLWRSGERPAKQTRQMSISLFRYTVEVRPENSQPGPPARAIEDLIPDQPGLQPLQGNEPPPAGPPAVGSVADFVEILPAEMEGKDLPMADIVEPEPEPATPP